MLSEITDDLPVVSNNHKLLAKFHSCTLTIMDTMRLYMALLWIIAQTPIGIRLYISFDFWISIHHKTNLQKLKGHADFSCDRGLCILPNRTVGSVKNHSKAIYDND